MLRLLRVVVVAGVVAMLVTAFATPDRPVQTAGGVSSIKEPAKDLKLTQPHGAVVFLAQVITARADVLVHGLPSPGALLAGAILVMPFGYSVFRTLRRKPAP